MNKATMMVFYVCFVFVSTSNQSTITATTTLGRATPTTRMATTVTLDITLTMTTMTLLTLAMKNTTSRNNLTVMAKLLGQHPNFFMSMADTYDTIHLRFNH